MTRIGTTVNILTQDKDRNRFISEGCATIVGRTPWEHYYWVRFVGSDYVVVRRIDPVGALLGIRTAAALNDLIEACGDATEVVVDAPAPAFAVRGFCGADTTLILDPFNFAGGMRMRGKKRFGS